jgi:hypothetical protein
VSDAPGDDEDVGLADADGWAEDEDENAGTPKPSAAGIAAAAKTSPATRIRGIRRVRVRAGWYVMPAFKARPCHQRVWGFPYADDMRRLVSITPCVC